MRVMIDTHLFRADEFICSRCGASCGRPEGLSAVLAEQRALMIGG